MACRKCSAELPEGAVFCHLCGVKQAPQKQTPKKRGNGQGSVYKRGKTYKAVVQIYKPERHRLSREGYRTRAEALAALPALREELLQGAGKKKETATLATLYRAWEPSAEKLSSSKQSAYRIAYGRIEGIANAPVANLTIEDLQRCVDGLTYYPARDVKTLLSHLYKRACAQQDVLSNLAAYIELPRLEETEAEPFSELELAAMWRAWEAGDSFVGFALLMIYTGMMPGEVLACKKDMIDFDGQKIVGVGKKTKERKKRPVMVPDIAMPVLRRLCDHKYASLAGMNKDKFYAEYHAMTARIGVRDLPPYSCRHTTATAMSLGDAIAPALVTKAMRQTRAITTERYKHATDLEVLDALNKLAQAPITRRE